MLQGGPKGKGQQGRVGLQLGGWGCPYGSAVDAWLLEQLEGEADLQAKVGEWHPLCSRGPGGIHAWHGGAPPTLLCGPTP